LQQHTTPGTRAECTTQPRPGTRCCCQQHLSVRGASSVAVCACGRLCVCVRLCGVLAACTAGVWLRTAVCWRVLLVGMQNHGVCARPVAAAHKLSAVESTLLVCLVPRPALARAC
jgi:hypothetical protein